VIWPESSITQAKSALSAALKKLSQTFSIDSANRNNLFFALGNDLSQARRLVALNRFETAKPNQIIIDEQLIGGIQALIAPALLLSEPISSTTPAYIEISIYKKSLSAWLSLLAKQINNETLFSLEIPTYNLRNANSESSLPIGYKEWLHALESRLQELEKLLRRETIPPEMEFNQSEREMR